MRKCFLALSVAMAMTLVGIGTIPYVKAQEGAEEGEIKYTVEEGMLFYEMTDETVVTLTGGATVAYGDWYGGRPGATNNSFVNIVGGEITLNVNVPYTGYYKIYLTASTYNETDNTHASVWINDSSEYYIRSFADEFCTWPVRGLSWYDYNMENGGFKDVTGGFYLIAGSNTVRIKYNNGWMLFDRLALLPDSLEYPEGDSAGEVYEMIRNLPESISMENAAEFKTAVQAAKDAYDGLDDVCRIMVLNAFRLERLFEEMVAANLLNHTALDGKLVYEVEGGMHTGLVGIYEDETASGGTYITNGSGTIYLTLDVPIAGYYDISLIGSTSSANSNKSDWVYINNNDTPYLTYYSSDSYGRWTESKIGLERWENGVLLPEAPEKGFYLPKGSNLVVIRANWGYTNYDKVVLIPTTGYAYGDGDANEDNVITVKDIVRMKRIMEKEEGCPENLHADIDRNYVIDGEDVELLRNILVTQ